MELLLALATFFLGVGFGLVLFTLTCGRGK